jgi:bacterioferritin-associated ferredoxin
MIICICHRVSDRDITRATSQGCGSFEDLQCQLAVATCCGKCHDSARELFDQCTAAPPQALQREAKSATPRRTWAISHAA